MLIFSEDALQTLSLQKHLTIPNPHWGASSYLTITILLHVEIMPQELHHKSFEGRLPRVMASSSKALSVQQTAPAGLRVYIWPS